MTDRNEVLRLAEIVWECIYDHGNGKYKGPASMGQRLRAFDALVSLRQQAERIAELEAERDQLRAEADANRELDALRIAATHIHSELRSIVQAGGSDEAIGREFRKRVLPDVEDEVTRLRAEVERLRVDAERWHVANLTAETAWKHPDHRSQEENTAFSAYRCAVEDGLNFEGAVDAAVAAIAARTTHKDEAST